MSREVDRVLQTLLDLYEIDEVEEYKEFLLKLYKVANDKVQKILQEWMVRFFYESNNNPIWWEEELSPGEFMNLQKMWEKTQHYVISGQIPQAQNLIILSNITRYEALSRQVAVEMLEISNMEMNQLSEVLPKIYETQYQKHLFNVGKELGVFEVDFNRFDSRELAILAAKNFPDGRNYKDIVFAHNQEYLPRRVERMVKAKVDVLAKGVVTGASPLQMGKELTELVDISLREATTLMFDELGLLNSESNLMGYKELAIEKYIYLATLETHTCTICRELDHQEFEVSEAQPGVNYPLIHSHCRCTTKAKTIFDGLGEGKRWNRIGNTKGLVDDMNFDEWLKNVYQRS